MEKKKLGLPGKSKLELSKTVRGGTVRQSFSHGRVKSVEVEVKKVRTFNKSRTNTELIEENKNISEERYSLGRDSKNDDKDERLNKDKLQKLKEEAQSDRIARENEISSTDQKKTIEKFVTDNKERTKAKLKSLESNEENKKLDDTKTISLTKDENNNKKSGIKKNRADLKNH